MFSLSEKRWHTLRRVLYIALALYAIAVVYTIVAKDKQWDFKTYYFAAKTHLAGENLYDPAAVSEIAGEKVDLEYVYPPVTIYFFYPFLVIPFPIALFLFLALKLVALTALIYLWLSYFIEDKRFAVVLFLLAAFAFRETIIRDLYAGNVSIFEQLLLWTALLFFMRKKTGWFCALIFLTAQFKFAFVLFLLLPFIDRDKTGNLMAVGTGAALCAQMVISYLIAPGMMANWLTNLAALPLGGHNNQTSFAVIHEILVWITNLTAGEFTRLDSAFHIGFSLFLLAFTYRALGKYDFKANRLALVVLALFLYTLIMPRMKDYSYVILIIPSLFVIERALDSTWARIVALFFLCVSFLPHQAWGTSFVLYLVYLQHLKAAKPRPV